MPEETGGTAEEKSSPHPFMGNMHHHSTCMIDHLPIGKCRIGPNRIPSQSKRTRPPGAKLGGCGVASPTPPSTSLRLYPSPWAPKAFPPRRYKLKASRQLRGGQPLTASPRRGFELPLYSAKPYKGSGQRPLIVHGSTLNYNSP
jgi:hypothetical protein